MSDLKRGLIVFGVGIPVAVCIGLWQVFLSAGVCEGIQAQGDEGCGLAARGQFFLNNLFIFGFGAFVWIVGGIMAGVVILRIIDGGDG
ncbi:MAG: hypothetical protein CME85_11885 [Henriciella sp.]|uniref:hypothetical protein n=1 Tax=Henriciella sp. TaxID=1968823 RepID=UPI000C375004|nr:hypothetical protein [Henriciella sp.]MBK76177.1 hypothetical protein [Henriciella sp.]